MFSFVCCLTLATIAGSTAKAAEAGDSPQTAARVAHASYPVAALHVGSADGPREDDWRRTADGWERKSSWPPPSIPPHHSALPHPLVVGMLLLLISIGALVALSPDKGQQQP